MGTHHHHFMLLGILSIIIIVTHAIDEDDSEEAGLSKRSWQSEGHFGKRSWSDVGFGKRSWQTAAQFGKRGWQQAASFGKRSGMMPYQWVITPGTLPKYIWHPAVSAHAESKRENKNMRSFIRFGKRGRNRFDIDHDELTSMNY